MRHRGPVLLAGGVGVALLLAVPFLTDQYFIQIAIVTGINVILASSLNLVVGYAGQLSLGHASFFGIGAYFSALMGIHTGISFWLLLPLTALFTGLAGFLIGLPSFRLRGHYLAVVTLGFGVILYQVFVNWVDVTRGVMGLRGIARPEGFLGITFRTKLPYYYLMLALIGLTLFIIYRIVHSRAGRALVAVREDEAAAQALGVHAYRYKVLCFAIAAALAGVAGSFHAHYQRLLAPPDFTVTKSFLILLMVIIGGMGNLWGSVLGAVLLTMLPEYLRVIEDYREVVFGLSMVVIIIFLPGGVIEGLHRLAGLRARIWAAQPEVLEAGDLGPKPVSGITPRDPAGERDGPA